MDDVDPKPAHEDQPSGQHGRQPLDAPLLRAWREARARHDPFTIPGHQRRAGRLDPELQDLLGDDVPLYGGLDEVKLTHDRLGGAERRAAALWGADLARFSTGGSTHGNQAALLAVAQLPGDGVLVARNAHRSVLSGLILTGLSPTWLPVEVDERLGMPVGLDPERLRRALEQGPRPKAVLLTEPAYLGVLSDFAALVATAHDHDVPVVVDQAWGAHLGFHPAYPRHAIAAGADLMVCSVHKTLLGYSQAALILAQGNRIRPDVLDRAVELTHTTSPAGSILASIDASRAVLERDGAILLGRLADSVSAARDRLRRIDGVLVPGPGDLPAGVPADRLDPAKFVIRLTDGAPHGVAVEDALLAHGIRLELADRDTLVPIVTLVDTEADLDRLCAAVEDAVAGLAGIRRAPVGAWAPDDTPEQVLTPREAFFAPSRALPWREAVGRPCAEVVAPYPPGVPELVPGERISRDVVERLRELAATGTRVAYAADPTLDTLRVVDPVTPGGIMLH